MKTSSLLTLFIFLLPALFLRAGQAAASGRYIVKYNSGGSKKDIYLWDQKQRRILWKRLLLNIDPANIHWSKDRRAVAIGAGSYPKARVLVWREGEQLRDLGIKDEYTLGCVWSPDNRRLLVRVGGSAANYLNYGELFCIKLGTWPNYKFFKLGRAGKMAWKNQNTVLIWKLKDDSKPFGPLGKPHLWCAP